MLNKYLKYSITLYVLIVIVNSILLPPLNSISPDNFIFPFALSSVIYFYHSNKLFRISGLVAIGIMTSALLSNYFAAGLTFGEILWSIRILKLFTIAWSTYYLMKEFSTRVHFVLILSFIGFSIINALQLLEVEMILKLYAPGREAIDAMLNSFFDNRIFGVFKNPNNNGLALALFAFYFLISEVKNKYIFFGISVVLMIMTQSRTAFLALTVASLLFLVFKVARKNLKSTLLIISSGVLFVAVLARLKLNNLSSLLDGTAFRSNSFTTRFDIADKVIDFNGNDVLFGQGKINNIPSLIGGSIDNEYLYVYLEYGLIGITMLLFAILLLSYLSLSSDQNKKSFGLILIMLICGMTNLTFSSLEVSGIFILLFVLSFSNTKGIQQQKAA